MDRDPGDYDSTEVSQSVPDVWHPSFTKAEPPALPEITDTGRQHLQAALSMCQRQGPKSARPEVKPLTCWKETPEPFRRLVARSAGLPLDVVHKIDRELSETEKAMIRAAAARLKERADALFAL
jgi:hypothetical protein